MLDQGELVTLSQSHMPNLVVWMTVATEICLRHDMVTVYLFHGSAPRASLTCTWYSLNASRRRGSPSLSLGPWWSPESCDQGVNPSPASY